MFSPSGFSTAAFAPGAFEFFAPPPPPPTPPTFEEFLDDPATPRCWLLELDAFALMTVGAGGGTYGESSFGEIAYGEDDGSEPQTRMLPFSTHGFTSWPDDTPASRWYDGRLDHLVHIDRRIAGREVIGGLARCFAQAELINTDGALDRLTRDYALDGRRARVLIGPPAFARSAFGTLMSGVTQQVEVTERSMTLLFSDGLIALRRHVQPTLYAGSGGLEGGADLAGKPKPLCYGKVFNISPPLVDPVNLIYQIHDGAIEAVNAVYDRGIALVAGTDPPDPGEFYADLAAGTITLGAAPAGTITCDAEGAATGGYVDTTAEIIERILDAAAIPDHEIDSDSITALAAAAPAVVGIWTGTEPLELEQVIDELLTGIGAYGGYSRLGAFTVGLIATPAGAPAAVLTTEVIIAIARQPLPEDLDPVVWRTAVGWQRNYTPQTDLAAAVSDARRSYAAQLWRMAVHEDAAIRSRNRLARELEIAGFYAEEAAAQDEADRRFALFSTGRGLYRVSVRPAALDLDLGDVVEIRHPRHGFTYGKNALVVGHMVRGTTIELTVFA